MTFGKALKELRFMHGLTGTDLAQAIQCSPALVAHWEHARRPPPAPTSGHMIRLRKLFGDEPAKRLSALSNAERKTITFRTAGRDDWERNALNAFHRAWLEGRIDEMTAEEVVKLLNEGKTTR